MTRLRRPPRILVVDDDPGLLRLLTIRLRSRKYEVEPMPSAARRNSAAAVNSTQTEPRSGTPNSHTPMATDSDMPPMPRTK